MSLTLITSDENKFINIGTSDNWISLVSTVDVRLKNCKKDISAAINFLISGKCDAASASEVAKQFKIIRTELSKFKPDQIIYDADNPDKEAPWKDNISPTITSCADFYTTADGKDLLSEIVDILTYAAAKGVSVELM